MKNKDIVMLDPTGTEMCRRSFPDEDVVISGADLEELCSGTARVGTVYKQNKLERRFTDNDDSERQIYL